MLRLAVGVILNLMVSAYPVLAITSLRVTPTANRNSFRVALSFIIVPRVEALRTSTLGYEIATPTELPGVRTVHGAYCLVITIGLKHANETYSALHQGNRGKSKIIGI